MQAERAIEEGETRISRKLSLIEEADKADMDQWRKHALNCSDCQVHNYCETSSRMLREIVGWKARQPTAGQR